MSGGEAGDVGPAPELREASRSCHSSISGAPGDTKI